MVGAQCIGHCSLSHIHVCASAREFWQFEAAGPLWRFPVVVQCLGAAGAPIRWRSCSSVRNMALQAARAAGAEARGQLRCWPWGCWEAGTPCRRHLCSYRKVWGCRRPGQLTYSRFPSAGSWPQSRSRTPAAPPPAASASPRGQPPGSPPSWTELQGGSGGAGGRAQVCVRHWTGMLHAPSKVGPGAALASRWGARGAAASDHPLVPSATSATLSSPTSAHHTAPLAQRPR